LKTASLNDIKKELNHLSDPELKVLIARLMRYKKENKELLSYLLFDAQSEEIFVSGLKEDIDVFFEDLLKINLYHTKKSLRKLLRILNRYIKFSGIKQTEVEVMIYFCSKMKSNSLSNTHNSLLNNLYEQQIIKINKAIATLHEDLQYDYKREVEGL